MAAVMKSHRLMGTVVCLIRLDNRCENSAGSSPPEWPDLGQVRIGVRRRGHRPVHAGVLAPGEQTSGKDAARICSATTHAHCRDAFFMHGDVVKIAKAILQELKRGKKLLAPFQRPLGRKQRGKKLRGITQLLGLDAQLVAAACIEPRQLSAFLTNLAPAPRQLLERERLDRHIAAVADKIIRRGFSTGRPPAMPPRRA